LLYFNGLGAISARVENEPSTSTSVHAHPYPIGRKLALPLPFPGALSSGLPAREPTRVRETLGARHAIPRILRAMVCASAEPESVIIHEQIQCAIPFAVITINVIDVASICWASPTISQMQTFDYLFRHSPSNGMPIAIN
jgi:hypothetical protein